MRIGLFGGTFDPIHLAHLRMAIELKQACCIDDMRLLPAHIPPHKSAPAVNPERRLAMLQLALRYCPELSIDGRELRRNAPSYTVDTLEELAHEAPSPTSLCLCIGADSLVNLPTWHRWRRVLELANIVVAVRPGYAIPKSGPIAELLASQRITSAELNEHRAGKLVIVDTTLMAISATQIRTEIAAGRSAQFWVPDCVWRYIQQHGLYDCHQP